jgi:hypothetical protein
MKNSLSKITRPTNFTTKYFANIQFVRFKFLICNSYLWLYIFQDVIKVVPNQVTHSHEKKR